MIRYFKSSFGEYFKVLATDKYFFTKHIGTGYDFIGWYPSERFSSWQAKMADITEHRREIPVEVSKLEILLTLGVEALYEI